MLAAWRRSEVFNERADSLRTGATKLPTLRVDSDANHPGCEFVAVRNIDPDLIASLDRCGQVSCMLESILRVRVVEAEVPRGENLPEIFGRYQVLEDELRFIPHFPFETGLSYRACFDPRPLGCPEASEELTLEFSLPKTPSTSPSCVQDIFPSSDCLPENLLRFYVRFSNSMQRGRAQSEIALLGPDGEPAPDVLYRAPLELWDRSMRCLTILLDPGRLKRGVRPNRELGPPLKAGWVYTLAIGAGMLDLSGSRLNETFYKRFRVTNAVREHIAVEQWNVVRPATESRQPVELLFPRPLDWALLSHSITVLSPDGQSIDGRVAIDQCERRCSFTPVSPWTAGSFQVRVASSLEDVCGNSVIAPFDRPLRSGSDLPYEVPSRSIAFNPV
jgi:hypothetical protein